MIISILVGERFKTVIAGEFMSQKKWKGVAFKSTVLLALFVTMIFSFQNCGKAGFDQTDLEGDLSSLDVDPKLASLPFPYDVTVNQAAFMSCQFREADNNLNNPYFSFKVGAFNNEPGSLTTSLYTSNAGLTIRPEFTEEFNRIGEAFNPTFRPVKYKEALTLLPSVANTQLQLSLRQIGSQQSQLMRYPTVLGSGGGETPVKNFMAPITSSAVAGAFLSSMGSFEQPLINYFQTAETTDERPLEGRLLIPWGSNAGGVEYYGPLLNSYSASYLTVGFAKDGNLLSGPGETGMAYGVGLKPAFNYFHDPGGLSQNFGSPEGSSRVNIALTSLREFDLSTGSPAASTWRCSDSSTNLMAFKIVKNSERFNKVYRRNNFSWPNRNLTGFGQDPNGSCPGEKFLGQYCPSPDNPKVFGRPLTEFPTSSGTSFLCPANRRLLPAPAAGDTGEPDAGRQLATGTMHAYGEFCAEQYEYACPAEPMFPPTRFIVGQPPADEGAYLTSSAEKLAIYTALRRFLPETDWDINVSKRCIVEKQAQDNICYISTDRKVIYDEYFFPPSAAPGSGRDQANPGIGKYSGCGPFPQFGDCPAFLTLCIRQ